MHLFSPSKRPHASYACPHCRQVNVLEESDLRADSVLLIVNCIGCGHEHGIEQSYMRQQLDRDLAAG